MDGVLAQEVVLPASAWVRAPAGLDPVEAATLTCAGVTAWHGLFGLAPIPAGGTVALLGTGGVSIWALQLAKAAGYRVVVSSSHDGKLEQARALGADETVNYRTTPAWGEAIRALSGGHGVDRVLDIGGADTVEQSIIALRTGGTIAIIGRLTGAHPAQFDPAALFGGGKSLAAKPRRPSHVSSNGTRSARSSTAFSPTRRSSRRTSTWRGDNISARSS